MVASDSGIAAAFDRVHKFSTTDPTSMVRKEEYLGWIEEIIEINYKEHCVVLFAYKWMKARSTGPNPTIVWDKYRFTSTNISDRLVVSLGLECFAFPIHVQQVFYYKDSRGSD